MDRNDKNLYERKMLGELASYTDKIDVHDLPEIFHYWSNKYLRPIVESFGFCSFDDVIFSYLVKTCQLNSSRELLFVSLCSGNCEREIGFAKRLLDQNIQNFRFECFEINPSMLERGRKLASTNDVLSYFNFVNADVNFLNFNSKVDIVLAFQCLHHLVELEDIFNEIKLKLDDDGYFIYQDMIGRNGHQRWPECKAIVDELWSSLPSKYKYNHLLKRQEELFGDWDCAQDSFEGIRAQDILPLLIDYFHCEFFIYWGGVIDVFIDRTFGPNFDITNSADLQFIDQVEAINIEKMSSGLIKPTQAFGVLTKNPSNLRHYLDGKAPGDCVRIVDL